MTKSVYFLNVLSVLSITTSSMLFSGALAYANHTGDSNAQLNREIAESQQARNQGAITIKGNLTCNRGDENTGTGCSLQIIDQKTGRAYGLTNINGAMSLFNEGKTTVAIRGKLLGQATIEIQSVNSM